MIAQIFKEIGVGNRTCVEFGASDGLSCSNTANLWMNGWDAYLIESDLNLFAQLQKNVSGLDVQTRHAYVERDGASSIDILLPEPYLTCDFMSIDVDGIDWMIFHDMQIRPRVISIEYNQSIPSHLSVSQAMLNDNLGASALALCEIASDKGYGLVGLTKGNLFFVVQEELDAFDGFERGLRELFDHDALTYLATDMSGRGLLLGASPPWGFTGIPHLKDTIGAPTMLSSTDSDELKASWEAHYGRAIFIPEDWNHNLAGKIGKETRKAMRSLFETRTNLILIDTTQAVENATLWIEEMAAGHQYVVQRTPRLLALVRKDIFDRRGR